MKTNQKPIVTVFALYLALAAGLIASIRLWSDQPPPPIQSQSVDASNLLSNGSFEGGQAPCPALWWDAWGITQTTTFGNVWCPDDWVPYWRDSQPCAGDDTRITGKPESRVVTKYPDPLRVYHGNQAASIFTFHRCHDAGFFQCVPAVPGQFYQASAKAHAWFSNCSEMPHSGPRDWASLGCVPLPWAWDELRLGISTRSPYDAAMGAVSWGDPVQVYGQYGATVESPIVQATGGEVCVIFNSTAAFAMRHDDVYLDRVRLWQVYPLWLPLVARDAT